MIKKLFWLPIIILVVIGAWYIFDNKVSSNVKCQMLSAECPYYAVHLVNGQVYYGRVNAVSDSTIKMEDVYYFETVKEPAVATSQNFALQGQEQTIYRLVRRGTDKPTTTDHNLFVNRQVVLFWEKLAADSDMVTMIVKAGERK